jgi:putative spermidine/putrescine transport system substrate-binding protein
MKAPPTKSGKGATFSRRDLFVGSGAALLVACGPGAARPPRVEDIAQIAWPEIEAGARNSEVRFAMWSGDDVRNRYFRSRVRQELQQGYGIGLELPPTADVAETVNQIRNEKRAGSMAGGSVDLVWINGENFRTMKQAELLWGQFAELLPNFRLYDPALCAYDFGTQVEGWEAPWLRAQFVFAYDSARFATPPRSLDALREWMQQHPGRFTYPAPPDFTGSAFLRHLLLYFGQAPERFAAGFDEDLYEEASRKTFEWLRAVKPLLWRQATSYPANPRELNRLFANREVDFSMNYSPMFASRAIERGEFPSTARTFVLQSGAIGNYSFLTIPFNASNVTGAMVVANHLMSFSHLLEATRVLGGPFPHDLTRLSGEQRAAVDALPRGVATLDDEVLRRHYIPEPDAEYLVRLEREWRQEVLMA